MPSRRIGTDGQAHRRDVASGLFLPERVVGRKKNAAPRFLYKKIVYICTVLPARKALQSRGGADAHT